MTYIKLSITTVMHSDGGSPWLGNIYQNKQKQYKEQQIQETSTNLRDWLSYRIDVPRDIFESMTNNYKPLCQFRSALNGTLCSYHQPANVPLKQTHKFYFVKIKLKIIKILFKHEKCQKKRKVRRENENLLLLKPTSFGKSFWNDLKMKTGTIKQHKEKIRCSVSSGSSVPAKIVSRPRTKVMEKMGQSLMVWIEDMTTKRLPLDGNVVK
ncbi:hypothetical protein GQX74_009177 [Glossina fuscipes]|nr:hypothetical protein GQX74_009177 [Glossina fuscipes]